MAWFSTVRKVLGLILVIGIVLQIMLLQRAGEMELQCVEEQLERGHLYRPRLHFENFIHCIADLYDGDFKHQEQLSVQFCSNESVSSTLLVFASLI